MPKKNITQQSRLSKRPNKLISNIADLKSYKLDGVGPLMTDPPPTNFTSFSKEKEEKKKKKSDT